MEHQKTILDLEENLVRENTSTEITEHFEYIVNDLILDKNVSKVIHRLLSSVNIT